MNILKYTRLALVAITLGTVNVSCMDEDWDDPTGNTYPYGNNNLQETNVVTIANLKDMYSHALIEQTDTARITEDIQRKRHRGQHLQSDCC